MQFYNIEKIKGLKQKIADALQPLINNNYVLLDVPNHRNIGDNLIWQGELDFLKDYVPYKMVYSCNHYTYLPDRIPKDAVILLHGGGNFGDIYPEVQKFRLDVVKQFPHNRIIVFPQTIFYKDKSLLKGDAQIFNVHEDIHVCVRDTVSLDALSKVIDTKKLLLLPDMAFCMDLSNYLSERVTGRTLIMRRTDKELANGFNENNVKKQITGEADVKDWPTYNISDTFSMYKVYGEIIEKRLSGKLINVPVLNRLVNPEFGLKSSGNRKKFIETGIRFINEYDTIVTTRLHGLILAVLLNKKVLLLDNSYGKIEGFYNTWLKEFKNIELLK
ncbi:polysaccharide pyruvyl transferase family protein [uncultured Chitinophaga sp.]|jgi:Exopolysaccharide biosynthesis protein|uniref:polysaccharide pyruvyl transferase family protein n=1 Tax=uncultured Chitinophaga sp. TaxID=339340 RepID=UPI0026060248|nr:polysaccharide pyruvyl transferase family protein [uncultured Chitinophaga sp.]